MKAHKKQIAAHAPTLHGRVDPEHLPKGVDRAASPPATDGNAASKGRERLKPEPPPRGCLPKFDSRYEQNG